VLLGARRLHPPDLRRATGAPSVKADQLRVLLRLRRDAVDFARPVGSERDRFCAVDRVERRLPVTGPRPVASSAGRAVGARRRPAAAL
jgi:hypothetical protein